MRGIPETKQYFEDAVQLDTEKEYLAKCEVIEAHVHITEMRRSNDALEASTNFLREQSDDHLNRLRQKLEDTNRRKEKQNVSHTNEKIGNADVVKPSKITVEKRILKGRADVDIDHTKEVGAIHDSGVVSTGTEDSSEWEEGEIRESERNGEASSKPFVENPSFALSRYAGLLSGNAETTLIHPCGVYCKSHPSSLFTMSQNTSAAARSNTSSSKKTPPLGTYKTASSFSRLRQPVKLKLLGVLREWLWGLKSTTGCIQSSR
ncbi:hypothetical protein RUND412_011656 [Rhizina undulata]